MIRRQPLTILLLIATVVVDVTLMVVGGGRHVTLRATLAGLLFGQTAALAMWAVWGSGHRLARVSTMVVATCVIALATGGKTLRAPHQWLAILSVYTLLVYFWSLVIAAGSAYTTRREVAQRVGPSWQVSLIELFGWTILVAIASFASRAMDFTFVRWNAHTALTVVLLLAIPVLSIAGLRRGLDDIASGWWYWLCFVLLLVFVAFMLRVSEPVTAVPLLLAQAGYLCVWLQVLRLDRRIREAESSEESSAEQVQQTEEHSSQLNG